MKLNPPDTAPKCRAIFADFGTGRLLPAVWMRKDKVWRIAVLPGYWDMPSDKWEQWYELSHLHMCGWLPLCDPLSFFPPPVPITEEWQVRIFS